MRPEEFKFSKKTKFDAPYYAVLANSEEKLIFLFSFDQVKHFLAHCEGITNYFYFFYWFCIFFFLAIVLSSQRKVFARKKTLKK